MWSFQREERTKARGGVSAGCGVVVEAPKQSAATIKRPYLSSAETKRAKQRVVQSRELCTTELRAIYKRTSQGRGDGDTACVVEVIGIRNMNFYKRM